MILFLLRLGQELQEVRSSDDEVHTGVMLKEFKIEPSVKRKLQTIKKRNHPTYDTVNLSNYS